MNSQRIWQTGVPSGSSGVANTNNGTVLSKFSISVEQTNGTGATWTVNIEGSLNGVNFTPILTHADTDPGDTQILSIGPGGFPCRFTRINVIALSLGTNTNLNVLTEAAP